MTAVDFAAWIIIGATLGKLLGLWEKRNKQVEELAASFEYEDDATSDTRKQQLLIRYSADTYPSARRQISANGLSSVEG